MQKYTKSLTILRKDQNLTKKIKKDQKQSRVAVSGQMRLQKYEKCLK